MNTNNYAIVMWGHFSVGESLPVLSVDDFRQVNQENADLGMIINDIDIARKLLFYSVGGSDLVVNSISGARCGDTCSRPSRNEVKEMIDWNFYQNAIDYMIKQEGTSKLSLSKINHHLDYLVDVAIDDRLEGYGIDKSTPVKIFKEKYLRNHAFRRLKDPKWKEQIERAGQTIVNAQGVPYCKGIMLSLFSILAEKKGYKTAVFYGTEHEFDVFNNSYALMQEIKSRYPDEKAWNLKLETRKYYSH